MKSKHLFWQALAITIFIFGSGFLFGWYFEYNRISEVTLLGYNAESSMLDTYALVSLIESEKLTCEELISANYDFANQIYYEARALEKFDEVNKITDAMKLAHRKYDIMRTILWIKSIEIKDKCGDFNTVVYLYEYDTENLIQRSKQNTFSRVLMETKSRGQKEFILIPIAVDLNVTSLNYLTDHYGIENFPAIIINEKKILTDNVNPNEILNQLN